MVYFKRYEKRWVCDVSTLFLALEGAGFAFRPRLSARRLLLQGFPLKYEPSVFLFRGFPRGGLYRWVFHFPVISRFIFLRGFLRLLVCLFADSFQIPARPVAISTPIIFFYFLRMFLICIAITPIRISPIASGTWQMFISSLSLLVHFPHRLLVGVIRESPKPGEQAYRFRFSPHMRRIILFPRP